MHFEDLNVFSKNDSIGEDLNDLPSLIKTLDEISYESKFGKNLKNTLRKFDKEELFKELENCCIHYYCCELNTLGFKFRVKALQSIRMKYNKYYPSKEVKSCFNDILGFRVWCLV